MRTVLLAGIAVVSVLCRRRLTDVMISTRSAGLLIDAVVCLTLAKWETVSGRFGAISNRRWPTPSVSRFPIRYCYTYSGVAAAVPDPIAGAGLLGLILAGGGLLASPSSSPLEAGVCPKIPNAPKARGKSNKTARTASIFNVFQQTARGS